MTLWQVLYRTYHETRAKEGGFSCRKKNVFAYLSNYIIISSRLNRYVFIIPFHNNVN